MNMPPFSAIPGLRSSGRVIGLLMIGWLILSCSSLSLRSDSPRGIYHRVKSGETLGAIARAYHVQVADLAEINGIANPDYLEADSVVFIPDVSQVIDDVLAAGQGRTTSSVSDSTLRSPEEGQGPAVIEVPKASHQEAARSGPLPPKESKALKTTVRDKGPLSQTKEDPLPRSTSPAFRTPATGQPSVHPSEEIEKEDRIAAVDRGRFIWPVKGRVISRFGEQPNRMRFNGIRIAAAEGAPVFAAADGVVIYSADLKGYGETVIIEHEDDYATVYTHVETRTVRKDHRVHQGDRIAFLGKTDNQEEPYLHFEIRHKYRARNPLAYLP